MLARIYSHIILPKGISTCLPRSFFDYSNGAQRPEVVVEFFELLLSFSKDLRTVTKRDDRAIWATFLRRAYQVGKAIHSAHSLLWMSSHLVGEIKSSTTNSMYYDIRRRIAKLGEYFQATIRIVGKCLSPNIRKYQNAITVKQVSMKSISITYFNNARPY